MTNEEAIKIIKAECYVFNPLNLDRTQMVNTALDRACKALEQDAKAVQFVKWVAREIFDDMWEYNKESFAEIACRKLAMLGIVKVNGDEWKLVEPQESEE